MSLDFTTARQGKHFQDLSQWLGVETSASEFICTIANGDGPNVVLLGGVHGDEYEAQIVLRRLAERLDPDQISGRLTIIPSINFPASQAGGRISREDGQNMNRVFPGKEDGTPTERLAQLFTDVILPGTDLLIDAHAGGEGVTVVPMIFGFSGAGCSFDMARVTAIMESWGYGIVQHVTGVPSTACGIALDREVSSIEIEGGGGGRLDPREVEIMEAGILRGLAASGVMTPVLPELPFHGVHVTAGDENRVLAPEPGLIEHVVSLGDIVAAGQTVALLHPIGGETSAPKPLASAVPGLVLRQSDQVFAQQGALVMNTGTMRGEG
ncbi:succinylglutamate desuccinylase/aspartoacylase family protein [Palleronia sp. LCG004]|uniref:succinylglutamate desuccinylase/aspartoacylase domain-containing protein n=1 Tax=Palleronia sp. LCG004 TaxID=3079304 RepID=UPI00294341AB|nr:succinylglutamate desuccinylase/aspartoacylase family protein [Palleronia sp. LCG004]WOI58238.1 succinylglutamate desuccinylase/aspartoacylase family protein [Palleronia sp. LCG004]